MARLDEDDDDATDAGEDDDPNKADNNVGDRRVVDEAAWSSKRIKPQANDI